MRLIDGNLFQHGDAMLNILNHAILSSTAIYDYKARTAENMREWFDVKQANNLPVIVALSEMGDVLGFASYGTFRQWAAFKYSVEHSLYVHPDHRTKGIGRSLLRQLILRADQNGVHVMVGGIDATNHASIHLHEKLGFTHSGTIKQAGYKFGKWLDLAFYQLLLSGPRNPTED